MLIDTGYIITGLITLYAGGYFLVTGSTRLASRFDISHFVIGATVIGFGTSAPELAVSALASLQGYGEIALGNAVGSNVANIGLVLGLTAILVPLAIEERRLKEEAFPLIFTSFLIVGFAWNNYISRIEGSIMILFLFIYLWRAFGKKEKSELPFEEGSPFLEKKGIAVQFCLVLTGLVMLVIGANWMVEGATGIARGAGISEWFIGVSIVALGTSLPELVSSIIAANRGHAEMAIGNVFGSNIFNILMVVGAASSIHPLTIREYIHLDLIYTTVLTLLLLALIRRGRAIRKMDGFFFIFCYVVYIGLNRSIIL